MILSLEPLLEKTISSFRLGIIKSRVYNSATSPELKQLISETTDKIVNTNILKKIREIETVESIRDAYKMLGNDPNRYRPAADSLLRRIIKGMDLYSISSVVDVLNLISIQTGFSISGFDAECIEGDIRMGIGEKDEPYQGIGRGDLNIFRLPVLRDTVGAFGTPTSDSIRTMIKMDTTDILFIFYDFGNHKILEQSLKNCEDLLIRFCNAKESSIKTYQFPGKRVV